jgi:hypothetical protein
MMADDQSLTVVESKPLPKLGVSDQPSLPSQLLDAGLNTLPSVGGVVGGVLGGIATTPETGGVGTIPGIMGGAAAGGAGGVALKNIINTLRGKDVDPSVRAAMIEQLRAAVEQGFLAGMPIALNRVTAPAAQETAGRMWTNAAGDTSVNAPQNAEDVLSRGMGRPTASNTSSLMREAAQGGTDAIKPAYRLGANGPELISEGQEATKSPLWRAAFAHKAYSEAPANTSTALTSQNWGMLTPLKAIVPSQGAVAQGIYSAANHAGPIGQLIRAAILSQLGQK